MRLVHHRVLTVTNAPGYVPVSCPPLNDALWQFATKDDLAKTHVLLEAYKWHDYFYNTYAESDAHLQKAMRKFT